MSGYWRDTAARTRTGFRQGHFAHLIFHFLTRFFMGDLSPGQSDMRLGIGVILALFSLPGAFVSILLTDKYSSLIRWLYHLPPVDYKTFSIPDKYMFVAYSTTVTGLVAVFVWDRLFPDRLDHANLAPLPISIARMFLAKLVALVLFFTLFVTALNLGSGALFPLQVLGSQRSLVAWGRFVLAHMAANAAGGFFAFFVIFALVGVMTLVLPRRRFQSISFAFQCISTIALVTLLFATPEVEALLPRIATVDHGLLRWLPTVWFLGLYQELAGGAAPAMHPLAARAVEALLAAGSASLLFYLASYQRCVRRIRESAESGAQKPGWLRTFGARWFDRYVLRRPFDRACFHFATSTLSRSRPHLLLMAGFAGLGMATALQYATAGWSVTPIGFGALPAATLLAPTLAISFFLLTGMRFVFDWPAELRANWTFQIVVEARMEAARRVARKLMSVLVIAPVSIASLILYGTICGIWIGLAEAGFLLLATLTLAEILLVDYAKIPFTSSYSGPKHNAGLTLAVYLLAFFLFSPGLAHLEHWTLTLRNPAPFLALIVLLATGWAGLSYFARARDRSGDQIIFSDEPEPALLSMDLR